MRAICLSRSTNCDDESDLLTATRMTRALETKKKTLKMMLAAEVAAVLARRSEKGSADKVIRALKHLVSKHRRQALPQAQERHALLRDKVEGMTGSGIVEAACKTLVTQRLKQSGMRWSTRRSSHPYTARMGAARSLRRRVGAHRSDVPRGGHPRQRHRAQAALRTAPSSCAASRIRSTPLDTSL